MLMSLRCLLVYAIVVVLIIDITLFTWSKPETYISEPHNGHHEPRVYCETSNSCSYTRYDIDDVDFSPQNIQTCPNVHIFAHSFVHLQNVLINPNRAKTQKGGEELFQVIGQTIDEEDLKLQFGYFTINCKFQMIPDYSIYLTEHAKYWMQFVLAQNDSIQYSKTDNVLTVAVQPVEYANLYHAMTEWYNVFLVAYIFRKTTNCKINVLLLDGHPSSALDITWSVLFGKVARAAFIGEKTLYRNLIWGIPGMHSPMNDHKSKVLPMVESFRRFFLARHKINCTENKNCQKLNILFIWRRDYVAHPRNPNGIIRRKIKNEFELVEKTKTWFPNYKIRGVQMDKLPMKEQIFLITKTNILIGMHGAGLSHALFLSKGSGIIELFPRETHPSNIHFKAIARWRKLFYTSWQNVRKWDDFSEEGSTRIPPTVLKFLIQLISDKICQG